MIFRLISLVTLLSIISCSPVRVVSTETNADDFSQYKTYGFIDTEISDKPFIPEIRKSIAAQLTARGLQESTDPDLIINIGTSVIDKIQTRDTDYRDIQYMGQRNYSWESEEVIINKYREGTVVIDFVDKSSDKLVWQGIAAGTIDGKQERMENRIEKGVRKLFERFPIE